MFGAAGAGSQYHHIVTQGGLNAKKIPAELLQNTDNIVRLPTLLHEIATDESIVLLGAELDAWWDEFSHTIDSDDAAAKGDVDTRSRKGSAILRPKDSLRFRRC